MSWLLDTKKTKTGTNYRFWSTMVDDWINEEWLTESEIKKFLFWTYFREFMNKVMKENAVFPNDWFEKKTHARIYSSDRKIIDHDTDEEFVKIFTDQLSSMGISMSISDGTHGFSTKKTKKK